jgi:hypothetical protein
MSEETKEMLDIWFFVGLILLVYGVIIGLTGIYYIFGEPATTTLGETNPCLWWGAIMIVGGLVFQAVSRYGRKKESVD